MSLWFCTCMGIKMSDPLISTNHRLDPVALCVICVTEVSPGCWTLTRDLHSEGVAADPNEVEGHTLHRHPPVGQPHGEDALHLHGSILLPLHLHRGSLERNGHLQSRVAPVTPVSLQHGHDQTASVGPTAPPTSADLRSWSVATYVGRIPKH